ncbi:hypothetical protein D3C83_08500 [compost metagenome]
MATKIMVVTTCDITELMSADARPKASSSRHGFPPTKRDEAMPSAIRRVRPCMFMA